MRSWCVWETWIDLCHRISRIGFCCLRHARGIPARFASPVPRGQLRACGRCDRGDGRSGRTDRGTGLRFGPDRRILPVYGVPAGWRMDRSADSPTHQTGAIGVRSGAQPSRDDLPPPYLQRCDLLQVRGGLGTRATGWCADGASRSWRFVRRVFQHVYGSGAFPGTSNAEGCRSSHRAIVRLARQDS